MTDIGVSGNDRLAESVAANAREPSISMSIGAFAESLHFEDIPTKVVERALLNIIDAVGVAFAATRYEFAQRALDAIGSLSGGDYPVIGTFRRMSLRDAAFLNGVLIHGLDYDDTHIQSVVHATASVFPAALASAVGNGRNGQDLVVAYIAGVEAAARLGMVGDGLFHKVGFHPTGILGAFGCAIAAAKLADLPADAIAAAQGIVGSMAGGLLEFLEDGAWTKRMHPGWAAASGITAAALAAKDFVAPRRIYEGRYGLFNTHLGPGSDLDLAATTSGLGVIWETCNVAIKPFPACHFVHAFADSAINLVVTGEVSPDDISSVHCLIAEGEIGAVCEPWNKKKRPLTDYEAKFSLPYVVAASLRRGQFGLRELDADVLVDEAILALADRVTYGVDPESGFPHYYSGDVTISMRDGRELRHREQVNRGAKGRPLTRDEVEKKYRENMSLVDGGGVSEAILDAIWSLPNCSDLQQFATSLMPRED